MFDHKYMGLECEIKKLSLAPDDVVIFRFKQSLSVDQRKEFSKNLISLGIEKCLVLDSGASMDVITLEMINNAKP